MTYIIHSWIKSIFGFKQQCGGSREQEARERWKKVVKIRDNIQNMVKKGDVEGLKTLYKTNRDHFGVYAYLTGAKGVEPLEKLAANKIVRRWVNNTAKQLKENGEDGEPSPIYYAFVREQ